MWLDLQCKEHVPWDAREIARKDKECAKGRQQAVVDAQKALRFEHRRRDGDDDQSDIVRKHSEYDHHRQRDQHERDRVRDRHYREKFACVYLEKRIQVQVLRLAERRRHSAEIGGDVLHDKDERGIFCLAARRQHQPSERQKCDQRHIVRHDHRAEVGDEHQRERHAAHIAERGDDPGRQPLEKTAAFWERKAN